MTENNKRRALKRTLQTSIKAFPPLKYIPIVGPIMRDIANFDTDPSARRRIFEQEIVLKQNLFFYRFAPTKWFGGLWLNRLGLQPARVVWQNLLWQIRPRRSIADPILNSVAEKLDNEGVAVLNNFLSAQDHAALSAEFDRLFPLFTAYTKDSRALTLSAGGAGSIEQVGATSELVNKIFNSNPKIEAIVSYAARRKINIRPELSFLYYECDPADLGKQQSDFQDTLHADVFYPSMKVFYYLDDTDREGGAFTYAPHSHRISWERLKLEYRMSVNYFSRLSKGVIYAEAISPQERHALKIQEIPQEAPGNSIVIFNTMGFHRRGDFTHPNKRQRRILLINFRNLDTLANTFA